MQPGPSLKSQCLEFILFFLKNSLCGKLKSLKVGIDSAFSFQWLAIDNSELMPEAVVNGSVKDMPNSVTEDIGKSFSTWSPCIGFSRLDGLSLIRSLSATTVGVEGGIGSAVRGDAES